MNQEDWTTVRVSKDTKAKLERLREVMLSSDDQAKLPLDSYECRSGRRDKRDRIGLDRVIRRLIADRERWQQRRQSASRGKRSDAGQASQNDL